jgi:hypothetical protein
VKRYTGAEARALLESATPGARDIETRRTRYNVIRLPTGAPDDGGDLLAECWSIGDARLIAAAPDLAATVEALEAERDALRRQVAELTALGVSLHKAAAAGRDAGTAEAVAFLRLQAQAAGRMRGLSAAAGATIADAMLVAADTIERGEHVAKEDR